MGRKPREDIIPHPIYEKDIEFEDSTNFWKYRGRKVCGYILDKATHEVCKRYPMPNGRCKTHGGSKALGIASQGERSLENLEPGDLPTIPLGEEYKKRLAQYEKNPDVYDLRSEIAKVTVLGEMLLDRLTETNLPEFAPLISSLTKNVAEIKERYHKINTGYFDIYSVKIIILQLIKIITDYTEKMKFLVTDEANIIKIDTYKAEAIESIENLKLPIIRE